MPSGQDRQRVGDMTFRQLFFLSTLLLLGFAATAQAESLDRVVEGEAWAEQSGPVLLGEVAQIRFRPPVRTQARPRRVIFRQNPFRAQRFRQNQIRKPRFSQIRQPNIRPTRVRSSNVRSRTPRFQPVRFQGGGSSKISR